MAREHALLHLGDPFFVAGVVLYWGEGDKASRRLSLVNSDPRALAFFIEWVRTEHDPDAEFVLALHLHEGNNDEDAREWWRAALEHPKAQFHKTFIKPAGTGHRKNHLAHGVCCVRMRRSGNAWHRTMVWIKVVTKELKPAALVE